MSTSRSEKKRQPDTNKTETTSAINSDCSDSQIIGDEFYAEDIQIAVINTENDKAAAVVSDHQSGIELENFDEVVEKLDKPDNQVTTQHTTTTTPSAPKESEEVKQGTTENPENPESKICEKVENFSSEINNQVIETKNDNIDFTEESQNTSEHINIENQTESSSIVDNHEVCDKDNQNQVTNKHFQINNNKDLTLHTMYLVLLQQSLQVCLLIFLVRTLVLVQIK